MIHLKRVYESAAEKDGVRYFVERLWPRGIKKEALRLDAWAKEAAPSTGLRRWFHHDPEKWDEFRCKYYGELSANPASREPILADARRGTVTLLYSSHDREHNNAIVLKQYLEEKLEKKPSTRPAA